MRFLWLWIGVAGACGAWSRFAVGSWIGTHHISDTFPWGTFLVNTTGCLFFGFVWSLGEQEVISGDLRLVLLAGFAGAFTTFSTYVFDAVQLYGTGRWWPLLGSALGQLAAGLAAMLAGLKLGRYF